MAVEERRQRGRSKKGRPMQQWRSPPPLTFKILFRVMQSCNGGIQTGFSSQNTQDSSQKLKNGGRFLQPEDSKRGFFSYFVVCFRLDSVIRLS